MLLDGVGHRIITRRDVHYVSASEVVDWNKAEPIWLLATDIII